MNIHYKIEKDTIVVTDQNGQLKMVPKYTQAEQVLVLENDIEAIDQLIEDKETAIQANKAKKSYKYFTPFAIAMYIAMCTAVLPALVCSVGILLDFIAPVLLDVVIPIALSSMVISVLLGVVNASGSILIRENQILTDEINCLREIRNQKEKQLEELKQDIDNSLEPQEKTVPSKKCAQELYKEAYHIIMNEMTEEMDCEEYKAGISQILDSLKEVEQSKQKILKRN